MAHTPGAPIPEFELRYPRAKAILLGVVALYVVTVVAVSFFILYTSRRGFTTELAAFWALALLPLALVAFVGPVRTFVRPHEIEIRYWRWSQTLKREDVLGWRVVGEHLHLERRDRRQPTVTFPLVDPRLREWVTGLDPFDPETYLLRQAEGSQEQRLQSLQSAKRLVRLYLISVGIASVWFLITDGLLPTLILIAAPPAAFLMTAHPSGLIRFQPH